MPGALAGKVAVVTGASRGVGKGVALGLGEAGATVYVTGRTVQEGNTPLPGTIGETAEAITRLGGQGIAIRCDHANDGEVELLFRRVKEGQGRLDILVNNAYSVPGGLGALPFGVPFWELPISLWDAVHTVGLRSHYVASWFAAPLMVRQGRGLVVNISSAGAVRHVFNVPYGVGKAGVDKLTADMAHELRPHGVAVISLWPGAVRTEALVANAERWSFVDLARAQSPRLSGRAVAVLAADANVIEKSGRALRVSDLAAEYGFTDTNGTLPPPGTIRLADRT
jgi:dehydrogenase/reductase SDR family protein 1